MTDKPKTTSRYHQMGVRRVRDDAVGMTISGTEYVLSLVEAKGLGKELEREAWTASECNALRGDIMNLRGWLLNMGDAETATADELRMMATKALAGVECGR